MKIHLMVLLPILLIGCGDQERKASNTEPERNIGDAEPEWKSREFERKAKVQSLIKQLADDSQENRQAAFAELRDKYIRRRDIAELSREVDNNLNPNAQSVLLDLYLDIISKWRLPNNLWISSLYECAVSWNNEAKNMGYEANVSYGPDDGLRLKIPFKSEYSTEVINLILDMEPKILTLEGGEKESISNNAFLATLVELMDDITILGVKDGKYTEITPSKVVDRKEAEHVMDVNRP